MALAYRTSVAGGTAVAATGVTVSITPVTNDLFVVVVYEVGDFVVPTDANVTDGNWGGVYTRVLSKANGTAGVLSIYVRNAALNGTTVTNVAYTVAGASTGVEMVVIALSGANAAGLQAVLQSISASGGAGVAPTTTFGKTTVTTNLTITAVGNSTNPPGLTAPTGWTSRQNVGAATPVGLQVATRDSGFVGTVITWGTTSGSAFATVAISLDVQRPGYDATPGLAGGPIIYPRSREGFFKQSVTTAGFRANALQSMQVLKTKQSTAVSVQVFMRDAGTGVGVSGAALTTTISKNGAAFATITPTVTDLGNGWYNLALTTTHTNTLGFCPLRITAPSAQDNNDLVLDVEAVDKQDAVRFGMSALPNAAAAATGGLPTVGTGAGQINVDGAGAADANVNKWLGTAAATPTTAGIPKVEAATADAAAVMSIQAGLATSSAVAAIPTNPLLTTDTRLPTAGNAAGAANGLPLVSQQLPAAMVGGRVNSDVGNVEAAAVTQIQAGLATAAGVAGVPAAVDTQLTSTHGAGAWTGGGGGGDPTAIAIAVVKKLIATFGGNVPPVLPLSAGVEDQPTQRAIRALEAALRRLTGQS